MDKAYKVDRAHAPPGFSPLRIAIPLAYQKTSRCTVALVSYNVFLTITMCLFYVSLNSELNNLRTTCKDETFNKTISGCKNYKTVDNLIETKAGLASSIEMMLGQYAMENPEAPGVNTREREGSPDADDILQCNDTEEMLDLLHAGKMESTVSRVTRAKGSQKRIPSGFAHFHGGRGINTNYNVHHVIDIWEAADWVDGTKFRMDSPEGAGSKITVHSRGLYYLYSQVTFRDINRYHGYTVYVGEEPRLQCYFENPVAQCTGQMKRNGVCSGRREERCAVCYTGGLVYINKKEKISIQMIFEDRIISGHKADTFFGLLKVK